MATQWHYKDGDEERGPIAFRDLVDLVRTGRLTENDLVRLSWNPEWQRADSVVGLFHMAGRSAEDLARLDAAAIPAPATDPIVGEVVANVGPSDINELPERPAWMTRLFALTGLRKQRPREIEILGAAPGDHYPVTSASESEQPAAAAAATDQLVPELAEGAAAAAGSAAQDAWSGAVKDALDHTDQRARRLSQPRSRIGRFARRISTLLAGMRGAGQASWLRPAFRIVCAIVCANLIAYAVESWSRDEALRFPTRAAAAGQSDVARHFPFVGKCSEGEYLFLVFDLMLAAGAGAWFTARWLDSHAE